MHGLLGLAVRLANGQERLMGMARSMAAMDLG